MYHFSQSHLDVHDTVRKYCSEGHRVMMQGDATRIHAAMQSQTKATASASSAPYKKFAKHPTSRREMIEINRCVANYDAMVGRRKLPRRGKGESYLRERVMMCARDPLGPEAKLPDYIAKRATMDAKPTVVEETPTEEGEDEVANPISAGRLRPRFATAPAELAQSEDDIEIEDAPMVELEDHVEDEDPPAKRTESPPAPSLSSLYVQSYHH